MENSDYRWDRFDSFSDSGGAEELRRRDAAAAEVARTGAHRSSSRGTRGKGPRGRQKSEPLTQRTIRGRQSEVQVTARLHCWQITWTRNGA